MVEEGRFSYVAVDSGGRKVRGVVSAAHEASAYERLRLDGLHPLRLAPARAVKRPPVGGKGLAEAEVIDLVANLGQLLKAGADMRTALEILGGRSGRKAPAAACRSLSADISAGHPLDASVARALGRHGPFVGAMVAAGEASGDLAGALARAGEILESRMKLRRKLGSILAYPGFVLASTVAAVLALLVFVVPALAPLVRDSQSDPPAVLRLMIAASEGLRSHGRSLALGLVAAAGSALLLHRIGVLGRLLDRLLLSGPAGKTANRLVYGAFAIVLGGMLSAGAPMSETLRLAIRSVRSPLARGRIEPVLQAVRQGHSLSDSLAKTPGFPAAVARLASVGEATGALGPMLVRAGKLEEEAALSRIETLGQLLGPALIVSLGGLVGLLMASLLSGVSQLGQSALQ
jgi:type II secretory pathway component PulF